MKMRACVVEESIANLGGRQAMHHVAVTMYLGKTTAGGEEMAKDVKDNFKDGWLARGAAMWWVIEHEQLRRMKALEERLLTWVSRKACRQRKRYYGGDTEGMS